MKIYVITMVVEKEHEYPEVNVTLYATLSTALEAYSDIIDNIDIKGYADACEEDEVATMEYRWWRVYDNMGVDSVTIELEAKEVNE
jgi:hypothetical protein